MSSKIEALPQEVLLVIAAWLPYASLRLFSRSSLIFSDILQSTPQLLADSFLADGLSPTAAILHILAKDGKRKHISDDTRKLEGKIISILLKPLGKPHADLLPAALSNEHEPAVRAIVAAGADLYGFSCGALYYAANSINMINLLLSLGLDTARQANGIALFKCCENPEILKFLIDLGVSIKDAARAIDYGIDEGVLAYACHKGYVEAVKILLDAGADIDEHWGMPLANAISAYQDDVIECLVERGVDLDGTVYVGYRRVAPVVLCCEIQNTEGLMILAKGGADLSRHAEKILEFAASNEMLDVVWMMVESGIKLEWRHFGEKLLLDAMREFDLEKFEGFVKAGARFAPGSSELEETLRELQEVGQDELCQLLQSTSISDS
ncbi:hypothetical protein HDU97_005243 [Phlyctochytrium planicorne]|nr:hypothetical protein HDU97_005243 [Phlyctochytrium planicorne]